ncbi:MAG TPA: ROK family protein, partial [Acidimicrobiales bacterium]|nr:ROK family protein [Acidimicrobiales bacterium]
MTSGEGAGERPACLAIDIGASKVAVAVVSPEGVVEDVGRLAVAEHPRDLFGAVCDLATARLERSRVDRVGVGCAGPMSAGGESVSPLNIPAWRDFPLRGALARELGLPVSVEGDARALALGEGRYGAARGVSDYLSMVVSTGVGGGLVLDGALWPGRQHIAGEWGHNVLETDGPACYCGRRGCVETLLSGPGLAASYRAL